MTRATPRLGVILTRLAAEVGIGAEVDVGVEAAVTAAVVTPTLLMSVHIARPNIISSTVPEWTTNPPDPALRTPPPALTAGLPLANPCCCPQQRMRRLEAARGCSHPTQPQRSHGRCWSHDWSLRTERDGCACGPGLEHDPIRPCAYDVANQCYEAAAGRQHLCSSAIFGNIIATLRRSS